jgi:hypothetical protein
MPNRYCKIKSERNNLPFVEALETSIILPNIFGDLDWSITFSWIFSSQNLDAHLHHVDWLYLWRISLLKILTKVVATIPDIPPIKKFFITWDFEGGAAGLTA